VLQDATRSWLQSITLIATKLRGGKHAGASALDSQAAGDQPLARGQVDHGAAAAGAGARRQGMVCRSWLLYPMRCYR
jgi:hypothetical protein